MKQFLSAFLETAIESIVNGIKVSAFHHGRSRFRHRLNILFERLRPNAITEPQSLTCALYQRPTKDGEQLLAYLLRQPIRDVTALLASNRAHNSGLERSRNIIYSQSLVRQYCSKILIPQHEDYLILERDDPRSRIVVSFHFGDFIYGCAKLFTLGSNARRKFVLSLNNSSSACYSNLLAGFGSEAPRPETELPLLQTSTARLSELLRAGNTSILLFCDLPPGLGEGTQVRLLNRVVCFSIGPAILAIANKVPILPLINFSNGEHNYVYLGRQIEPELMGSESLRIGARRITQELASFFEAVFVSYPEQWRFVSLLERYQVSPG